MNAGRLRNWLNCSLVLPRQDRLTFYALMRAQVEAGIPAGSACETLLGLGDLNPTLLRIARAGAQAGHEGRLVVDGLAGTNLFPPPDIGVLRIAESNGTLSEALLALEEQAAENLGFAGRVVAPNLYYLVVFSVLLVLVWQAQDFMGAAVSVDLSDNPAWRLSAWLQAQAFWLTGIPAVAVAGVWIGKTSWTGPARRLLAGFDAEARYRFSLQFVRLAELLSRHGASHGEILSAAGSVLGHHRYVARAVQRARRAIDQEGTQWESAVADGLLSAEHAGLLAGLVPGGRRRLYPRAYRVLGEILRQLLVNRYRFMSTLLRIVLLGGCLALLLTMLDGVYSLLDSFRH